MGQPSHASVLKMQPPKDTARIETAYVSSSEFQPLNTW